MPSVPEAIQVGEWRVEQELDLIARNGQVIKVEPRAMRVLACLISHAGHVVSVEELLEQAWPDVVVGPDSVYQAVGLLRRTLGDDRHRPAYIEHIPRKGYRLVAPVSAPRGAPDGAIAPSAPGLEAPVAVPMPARPDRLRSLRSWAVIAVAVAALSFLYLLVRGGLRAPPAANVAAASVRSTPHAVPAAPSLAVLPFLDMSEKQDLGYFADGLSEELIDLLSRGSHLRVPARTSSFYFKGKSATVPEIASSLNVDHLLEGSVRRSGNRVRITAQLIRAETGYHLWSQTYERELKEIFALEDDIARAVASSLQVRLNLSPLPPEGAGVSTEAHNLLLECQFFVHRNTGTDIAKAVDCYRRLVTLAPQDAPAWAGYAYALWRVPFLTYSIPDADQLKTHLAARQAAEHALALDPHLAAAHATLAIFHHVAERDWAAADREIRAALAADPDDPASLLEAAALARDLGQLDRALDFLERARVRDPLNPVAYSRLSVIYVYLGRLPEAEAAARRRVDLSPEGLGVRYQLADVLLARGQAQAALEATTAEPNEQSRLLGFALAKEALGRRSEADAAFDELRRKFPGGQLSIAEVYAARGEPDRALAALDQAADSPSPDSELLQIQVDRYFKPLHRDPRYQAVLRKLGFPLSGPG